MDSTARPKTPRKKLLVLIVAVVVWLMVRDRIGDMDSLFFQPSLSGAKALVLYFVGDYSGAARSYRSHFQEKYLSGASTGDEGLDAILRSDWGQAKNLSEKALKKNPRNMSAMLSLGEVALENGAWDEALGVFQKVLAEETDQFDALVFSAVIRTRAAAYPEALNALDRALRYSRSESRVTTFLSALQAAGDLEKRPKEEQPAYLLADFHRYFRINDPWQGRIAIKYADAAIASGNRADEGYFIQGVVYSKQEETDRALDRFLRAIELNPGHAEARRRAAQLYSDRGDIARQYTMLKEAFEVAPLDPFYADTFTAFLNDRLGDYHQALEVALKALQASPEDTTMIHRVGFLYHQIGNFETAIKYYRQLIARKPDNSKYHEDLGESLLSVGRNEQALAEFQQAIKINPYRAWPHIRMGEYFRDNLQTRKAIAEYKEALKVGGPNDHVLHNLCMAYHRIGEFEQALPCFKAVLAKDPENMGLLRLLESTRKNLPGKKTP